jgi:hypothetical protein
LKESSMYAALITASENMAILCNLQEYYIHECLEDPRV